MIIYNEHLYVGKLNLMLFILLPFFSADHKDINTGFFLLTAETLHAVDIVLVCDYSFIMVSHVTTFDLSLTVGNTKKSLVILIGWCDLDDLFNYLRAFSCSAQAFRVMSNINLGYIKELPLKSLNIIYDFFWSDYFYSLIFYFFKSILSKSRRMKEFPPPTTLQHPVIRCSTRPIAAFMSLLTLETICDIEQCSSQISSGKMTNLVHL